MFRRLMMLAVLVVFAQGCSRPPAPTSDGFTRRPSALTSTESTPSPGIIRSTDEEVLAVGTLVFDRETDTFVLINAGPKGALTGKEPIIAQVGTGKGTTEGGDLVGLIGAYIEFRGKYFASTEASVTYPRITPDSMRIIGLPSER